MHSTLIAFYPRMFAFDSYSFQSKNVFIRLLPSKVSSLKYQGKKTLIKLRCLTYTGDSLCMNLEITEILYKWCMTDWDFYEMFYIASIFFSCFGWGMILIFCIFRCLNNKTLPHVIVHNICRVEAHSLKGWHDLYQFSVLLVFDYAFSWIRY